MQRFRPVTLTIASVFVLGAALLSAAAAQAAVAKLAAPLCQTQLSLCADAPAGTFGDDVYVGHDEPSVLFKSSVPGSGNDMTYTVTLPQDPKRFPTASGATGTTWDFQLRPTFWFGLTLCDTESAPEFTKTCNADTDANNLVSSNPSSPNYIGKHPGQRVHGAAVLRARVRAAVRGIRLHRHQYCAAMTIDSLSSTRTRPGGQRRKPTTPTATTTCWAGPSRSTGHTSRPAAHRRPRPIRCSPAASRAPNFAAVDPDLQRT